MEVRERFIISYTNAKVNHIKKEGVALWGDVDTESQEKRLAGLEQGLVTIVSHRITRAPQNPTPTPMDEQSQMMKDEANGESENTQLTKQEQIRRKQLKAKEDERTRLAIHSMQGQTRWVTFFVSVANAIYLWLKFFPPSMSEDPDRVDLETNSLCSIIFDDFVEGYMDSLCSFVSTLAYSFAAGITTFGVVMVNYTAREDPWFLFHQMIGVVMLASLNVLLVCDAGVIVFRINYVLQPVAYYYMYIVMLLHILAADYEFIKVILFNVQPKTTATIHHQQENQDVERTRLQTVVFHIKKALVTVWDLIKEEPGFRYNVFILIVVATAANIVIYIFIFILYQRNGFLDCLKDFNDCIQGNIETYVVFVEKSTNSDLLLPFIQAFNITMDAGEKLYDSLFDVQQTLLNFNDTESLLQNITNTYDNVTAICESALNQTKDLVNSSSTATSEQIAALTSLSPEIVSFCTQLVDAGMQELVRNIDTVDSVVQKVTQINGAVLNVMDQTEQTIIETQTIIEDDSETSSSWTEGLDTVYEITSAIGFTIGLLIGLSVLYITLASFKRRSIELRLKKVIKLLKKDQSKEDQEYFDSLKGYSIVSSIYFFGIVISTSALQMYIFSYLLTFCLTVLFSPWFWKDFLKDYYGYIIVYAAMIIVNNFVIFKLGGRMVTPEHTITRPAIWLAYFIICSFSYLILGILYAFYRMLYLLMTTLISISRMDVTLFTVFSFLDNGHNAFMGLLLMSYAMTEIGMRDTRTNLALQRWDKIRQAIQDKQSDFLEKVRSSSLSPSSNPFLYESCLEESQN
eukprot:TRINITY_DN5177_c1_g1_i5.p1 TRINITY_DN5177_c1_g1~~TRINITY_DN5177_c1_g1_i5.p1  ORF type:complete len:800 (-),score=58.94 TRINITY_DN5177_c1_g1_i5:691-3090(-)